jgi:hypothetical protein
MLGGAGGYAAKVGRLREAGVTVHGTPWDLADAVVAQVASVPARLGGDR